MVKNVEGNKQEAKIFKETHFGLTRANDLYRLWSSLVKKAQSDIFVKNKLFIMIKDLIRDILGLTIWVNGKLMQRLQDMSTKASS